MLSKLIMSVMLTIFSVPVIADSVVTTPPTVGAFSMTPQPITCVGVNDKITWTGSTWACAKDNVNSVKPMPYAIAFLKISYRSSGSYYTSSVVGELRGKGSSWSHLWWPVRRVTREVCSGGRRRVCSMQTVWDKIPVSTVASLVNQNYNIWKGMNFLGVRHSAYSGYSEGSIISVPLN